MKHETAASNRIGLGILSGIVLLVAGWLALQGSQSSAVQAVSTSHTTADRARFDTDSWNLPKEALVGFVEIPAGSFVMGSDPTVDAMAFENEQWSTTHNQGTVDVAAFYIGRYEVTVAQFSVFVAATNHPADTLALNGAPDHPVVAVSWTDALAYARWLERQLQQSALTPTALKSLLQTGWRITLPTEAQWEKAARASDGRIYPWGNVATHEHANYSSTSTTAVGVTRCLKCAFGLSDMSGNVWELTRSPYRPYPFDESIPNLQAPALFVMRGGAFNDNQNTVRAAVRGGIDPGARRPFIGFRLVITPP